ncbi:MAG: hypothetical protein J3K34DRAFT_411879 [Monoraphidium minutum]|nr:MAG: hypothetical protein J3K34DRAFT_411879 [Monoraphidium minutum]
MVQGPQGRRPARAARERRPPARLPPSRRGVAVPPGGPRGRGCARGSARRRGGGRPAGYYVLNGSDKSERRRGGHAPSHRLIASQVRLSTHGVAAAAAVRARAPVAPKRASLSNCGAPSADTWRAHPLLGRARAMQTGGAAHLAAGSRGRKGQSLKSSRQCAVPPRPLHHVEKKRPPCVVGRGGAGRHPVGQSAARLESLLGPGK